MLKSIAITEFRRFLKDYLHTAGTTQDIYKVSSPGENEVYLMSTDTLEKLQQRHYINTWARNQFETLKLHRHLTLINGKKATELPLDTLLGLSALFQLMQKLLNVLSRPGAKQNALKWDVSEYVEQAAKQNVLEVHGKFDEVHSIIVHLFLPNQFKDAKITSLYNFFLFVHNTVSEHPDNLEQENLTEEQLQCVSSILDIISAWAKDLIELQAMDIDMDSTAQWVILRFKHIIEWYKAYIGELPATLGYDPGIEIESAI